MTEANRVHAEIERFDPTLDIGEATPPPASWYTDPAFLELELRSTFARHWQFVGRVDQVQETGDYFTGSVARRPYVVVRGEDGELHAFDNVCAHHGTRVADGCGRLAELTCPYHGWQYALDGRLTRAPGAGAVSAFRDGTVGLRPLPVTTCGPFVLLHLGGPDGAARDPFTTLDGELGALDLDGLHFVERRDYRLDCNWKVFTDNYLDGGYHVAHMHPALAATLELRAYASRVGPRFSVQSCPAKGGRLGEAASYVFAHPNFMINRYGTWMDTNLVLPDGPHRCTVVFDYWHEGDVDHGELARQLEASDRVQQEDTEIATRVQEGLASGVYQGLYAPKFEAPMYAFHKDLAADFAALNETAHR